MSDVLLRPVAEADAPALLAIYAPYVRNTAIPFEYDVPTEAEFTRRIRTTLTRFPYLAAVRDGEILGYAYTGPFAARPACQWAAETSIYIRQDVHRLGLGKRLYEAVEAISKAQGLTNLYAKIRRTLSMARSKYQVLVIPYYFDREQPVYGVFRRRDMGLWQFISGGGEDCLLYTSPSPRD